MAPLTADRCPLPAEWTTIPFGSGYTNSAINADGSVDIAFGPEQPADAPNCADTELGKRSSKVTKGRSLRIWHSHADAAPECDPRHPGRSATWVTVSEPVNTRRPVSALDSTTGWKAVERKRFGNHCKADEFEHEADANASG